MGRRGNPYDNAKAESFMKTLKVEAAPTTAPLRQPLAASGDAASAAESRTTKTKGNLIVVLSTDGLHRS